MESSDYKWYQVIQKLKLWWWRKRHAVLVEAVQLAWEECLYCGNNNEERIIHDYPRIRCIDCGHYWDDPYWETRSMYADDLQ